MTQRKARAELHYTDFGDAETFRDLLDRHGLAYADSQEYGIEIGDDEVLTTGWHIWCGDDDLHLLTTSDPIDGEHLDETVLEERVGYASYTQVIGPEEAAEDLYRDVLESAAGVKGEFVPLTTEDGEVLAEMEEVLGTTRYNM